MEIETKKIEVKEITPSDGMWLTRKDYGEGDKRIFSKKVYLAVNDSPDNWEEVSDEYKNYYDSLTE